MDTNIEIFLEKVPHYWRDIEGGKIVFFCLPASREQMYIYEIDAGTDSITFHEAIENLPAVVEIEEGQRTLMARGLCQSPHAPVGITSHRQCQDCPKRMPK